MINPTHHNIAGANDAIQSLVSWGPLTAKDVDGAPLSFSHAIYPDRTIQVEGEFAGARILIEGSNDLFTIVDKTKAHWHTLLDHLDLPLEITDGGIYVCPAPVASLRPRLQFAKPTTSIIVTLFMRRASA